MNILQMLQNGDNAYLAVLVEVWGVRLDARADTTAMIDGLFRAMTDPERTETVWDKLDDKARGAMQFLIGSGGTMPESKFAILYGKPRRMGEGQIRKLQPHRAPENAAEALYYRGLIALQSENSDAGPRTLITVPADLRAVLPLSKTSYANLSDEDGGDFPDDAGEDAEAVAAALEPLDPASVQAVKQADTSLVDDMTTLLAYLRLKTPLLDGDGLSAGDIKTLTPHLLTPGETRVRFMIAVGIAGDLIDLNNGRAAPSRTGAAKWLGKSRHEQVRTLAEAWRGATVWFDLWQVPGLRVDAAAGTMPQYKAETARATVLDIMAHTLPAQGWWSMDEFIEMTESGDPDFQRPNGDFDSWYIYDASGALLAGQENWYAVEGAMLDFIITGPLHWLGLVDLGQDAARLTAYGRAFFRMAGYPSGADTSEPIEIAADATVRVPRKAAREDRYQVARFASWVSAGNVYVYKLDRAGLANAEAQGINANHVLTFLKRANGDRPLPEPIVRALELRISGAAAPAGSGPASAPAAPGQAATTITIERVLVLRTLAPETLNRIFEEPPLRRFVGARLGEMAVMLAKGADLEAFTAELAKYGIAADLSRL